MSKRESGHGTRSAVEIATASANPELTTASENKPKEIALEVAPERPVQVCETGILFRLTATAANSPGPSGSHVALVAADSEDEARRIAFLHDAFGRDWRNPEFASAESLETTETHVHGDVVFRSEPAAPAGQKQAARRS